MEETLLNRLKQMINNITLLKDSAGKFNSVLTLDSDQLKEAKLVSTKLETFLNRFNIELNNYFKLSNDPSADEISSFTSIQLEAEEIQIELSMKLKEDRHEIKDNCRLSSKLPKLNLPTFNGNILHWQEFWDQYNSNIHDRDLPKVDKLSYLRCSLQGAARSAIEGLENTNKNYDIAIITLKERYGKENHIIDAHYSALSKIRSADNTTHDCRRVLNEVERHLRVLNSLGENVGHNHLRFLILEKFPEELVYELKTNLKTESINEIRTSLERIISAREESSQLVHNRVPSKPSCYTVETLHTTDKGYYPGNHSQYRRLPNKPYKVRPLRRDNERKQC